MLLNHYFRIRYNRDHVARRFDGENCLQAASNKPTPPINLTIKGYPCRNSTITAVASFQYL